MEDTTLTKNINNDVNYDLIVKSKNDILDSIGFESEEDKCICDTIITNLEKYAAENIRKLKVVNIPSIGCIRINPIKRKVRDNFNNFKLAKSHMTKEEYKDYAKEFVNYHKELYKEKDIIKRKLNDIKRNNKHKYDKYASTLGKAYADMFIYSIYLLEELPFDKEWEEQYQKLKEL